MKKYLDFLLESIDFDLDQNPNYIQGYGKLGRNKKNRLIHLLFDLDRTGSPRMGEKLAGLLLNAINLNYYNKSYPFVDLIVKEAIEGITVPDEYISVKTSSTKHKLYTTVTDVNGYKLSQVMQFILHLLPLEVFKNKIFKSRNSIRIDSLVTVYYRFMMFFKDNIYNQNLFEHLFGYQLYYFYLFKKYLDEIRISNEELMESKNEIYVRFFSIVLEHVVNTLNTTVPKNYRIIFGSALRSIKPSIVFDDKIYDDMKKFKIDYNVEKAYSSFLPSEIANKQISFCILYFEEDITKEGETDKIVLHLQKTKTLSLKDVIERSTERWKESGKYKKITRAEGKQNIYFNFKDIMAIFEPERDTKDPEFSTHLKIIISKKSELYKPHSEEQTDVMIKVIDEIKGLPNDELAVKILDNINKIVNLDDVEKEKFVQNFDDFLSNLIK